MQVVNSNDNFGISVSISNDGNRVIAGAQVVVVGIVVVVPVLGRVIVVVEVVVRVEEAVPVAVEADPVVGVIQEMVSVDGVAMTEAGMGQQGLGSAVIGESRPRLGHQLPQEWEEEPEAVRESEMEQDGQGGDGLFSGDAGLFGGDAAAAESQKAGLCALPPVITLACIDYQRHCACLLPATPK